MESGALRVFVALCRERSFSGAAARLYTSHSQVSRTLSALEGELGARLVERNNRFLGLTPAGERLLVLSEAVLERMDAITPEALESAEPAKNGEEESM